MPAQWGKSVIHFLVTVAFVATGSCAFAQEAITAAQSAFFEQKIRPVLIGKCYECHSDEQGKRKGGLVLDSREGLLKGGDTGPAVVAGDLKNSRLLQAIRHESEELQMPPEDKLSPTEIAAFEEWVRQGAPDPRVTAPGAALAATRAKEHWAFKSVQRPAKPETKNKRWAQSPIDELVLAALEERKMTPSAPADKETLLRRVTFDITGLPPTPAELDAFVADNSEGAFARVVDRLLESPRFGERWARHWLDVARYADSNGLENNAPYTNAWRYRDYVVASFNQDKPFNRFIVEQLAGDRLPSATDEESYANLIATGFLMLGPKPGAGGDRDRIELDVVDEQIDATTKAFLGLTVSCARCHDHKFDPIPTKDYYAMAGIFLSTQTLAPNGEFGNLVNERPIAPREIAAKYEAHQRTITDLEAKLEEMRQIRRNLPGGIESAKLEGIAIDNKAAEVIGNWKVSNYSTNFVDQDYLHDGDSEKGKKSVRFTPTIPKAGFYEVRVAYTPRINRATNVPVTILTAKGPKTIKLNQRLATTYNKAFVSLGDFEFAEGTNGSVTISNEGTKGFVVVDAVQFIPAYGSMMASTMMQAEPAMMAATFSSVVGQISPEEVAQLTKIRELRQNAPPTLPTAMAPSEATVRNAQVRIRGEPQRLGDVVPRGALKILESPDMPLPQFDPKSSGRLELAEWIASPANPLTARVYANRVWAKLIGRGLVDSVDNFGVMGERPTHPELLDELAAQLVEDGWSTKKLIRRIALSSVYQQRSEMEAKAHAKDPDNRYLWRMNRKRLEAEAIRDAMLMASGRIQLASPGGPSSTNGLNRMTPETPDVVFSSARRSLYLPVLRNNVPDFFNVLDFPDPHTVNGKRHITVAAPQALFFMNSPVVMQEARAWAERIAASSAKPEQIARDAYRAAYGREPRPEEAARAVAFIERQRAAVDDAKETDPALRANQIFCQALFASSEFRIIN